MKYTADEIRQYVAEEDIKFLRLAFCDIFGSQKNISILPDELERALTYGIAFDASAVPGFGDEVHSDLFLHPDTGTLCMLPWRPDHGRVARMFCHVLRPNGAAFDADCRARLRQAVADAEQMGIRPECSHHEQGPGQNEIDFRYSDPLTAADNAVTFRAVVNSVAVRNGLAADFSPKPLADKPGNGMHINISAKSRDGEDVMPRIIAGILSHVAEMTVFLNTREESYHRFGSSKAPRYISWSSENRSQLIRIPAAQGEYRRAELRSPDPLCSPYLAFTLLIRAGLDGINRRLVLPDAADVNFYTAPASVRAQFHTLPETLEDAKTAAAGSEFIAQCLPDSIIRPYTC